MNSRALAAVAVLSVLLGGNLPLASASSSGDSSGSGTASGGAERLRSVTPRAETPGVNDDEAGGDADADDPAIWVDRRHPARTRVIGTVKNAGLWVYDLKGRVVQSIAAPAAPGEGHEPGRFNNVDIVEGFKLGRRRVDLAVASDRGRDQLRAYVTNKRTGKLRDVTARAVPFAFSSNQTQVDDQATVYGLTTWVDRRGRAYAIGTRRHSAQIAMFRLLVRDGRVTYRRVDTLRFPTAFRLPDGTRWAPCEDPGEQPQLEGLVVDPASRTLYAAQEDVGLWRVRLRGGTFSGAPRNVERTQEFGVPASYDPTTEECAPTAPDRGYGGRIAADTEGLAIYPTGKRSGTLLVSSQGDNTFYTYDRRTLRPLKHFQVASGARADGSQDCDGADVVRRRLPGFPNGLLVVQDGDNTPEVRDGDGEVRVNIDFKLLDAGILRH